MLCLFVFYVVLGIFLVGFSWVGLGWGSLVDWLVGLSWLCDGNFLLVLLVVIEVSLDLVFCCFGFFFNNLILGNP